MKFNLLGNRVAVSKIVKPTSKSSFLQMPETDSFYGVIEYVGPLVSGMSPGQKVYIGSEYKIITFGGRELIIMDANNIVALVTE